MDALLDFAEGALADGLAQHEVAYFLVLFEDLHGFGKRIWILF